MIPKMTPVATDPQSFMRSRSSRFACASDFTLAIFFYVDDTEKNMAPPAPIGIWGPVGWRTLHDHSWFFYADTATDEDRRIMKSFLDAYAAAIPCPSCRRHFTTMLARDVPSLDAPALAGNEQLFATTVAWHNEVNERKGKSVVSLSTARSRMLHRASGSSAELERVFAGVALASLALFGVALARSWRKAPARGKQNASKRARAS